MRCFALASLLFALTACRAPVARELAVETPTCEGLGGYAAGFVDVPDFEAHALIEWANNASGEELQAVCGVGPSLAKDLEAARPYATLSDVDAVPMVGPATLQEMLGREGHDCQDKGSVLAEWCALEGTCECQS